MSEMTDILFTVARVHEERGQLVHGFSTLLKLETARFDRPGHFHPVSNLSLFGEEHC